MLLSPNITYSSREFSEIRTVFRQRTSTQNMNHLPYVVVGGSFSHEIMNVYHVTLAYAITTVLGLYKDLKGDGEILQLFTNTYNVSHTSGR